MASELRRLVEDGATVVVADGLAAQQWEAFLMRGAAAAAAWRSAPIVAWDVWADELWGRHGSGALPLRAAQSLALWRKTIAASPEAASLIGVAGAAEWAAEAHRVLRHWQLDPAALRASPGERDFRAFLAWCADYRTQLHDRGWTDAAEIAAELPAAIPTTPGVLAVADLREIAPAQEALLAALEQHGTQVVHVRPQADRATARRIALADASAELHAAARWACDHLDRHPAAALAVVVPDLEQHRLDVERIFSRALPDAFWHRAARLADQPLVGAALTAVELVTPRATFATLSRWLRNPIFSALDAERSARALLEQRLRGVLAAQLPFVEAYRTAGLAAQITRALPTCAGALDQALAEVRGLRTATPSRWAAAWQRAIRALGWPPADLGADDPAVAQWDAALDALGALTPVHGAISADAAFGELQTTLQRTGAARPMPLAGVHVLGDVDEIGPGYAAVWVTGFTDSYWPRATRANPLLPLRLQRTHGLPWSSPQDARDRSARSLEALFGRTTELVFSWPARVFDYAAQPSPALRDVPASGADLPQRAQQQRTARGRETLAETAPALAADVVPGGVAALDHQAKCPLRAFCEHRLGAQALAPVPTGLPDRWQGIIAHRALELLYATLPSSADLPGLAAAGLIERCIERALDETFGAARRPLAALYALEQERLRAAIGTLLGEDLRRGAFRVAAVEERRVIQVDRWSVRIRIDRRDTLADGSTAVIDYKTGEQVSTADWFKERLRDVQVPLYAAHAAEPVAAAVLARVGAGAAGYLGVWQTPGAFPPRSRKLPGERSWPAQLATWRRQVGELVAEYAAGDLRLLTGDADLDEARGAYAPLTRVLEQVALARGALQPWQ